MHTAHTVLCKDYVIALKYGSRGAKKDKTRYLQG
jgi:hypothetical protein